MQKRREQEEIGDTRLPENAGLRNQSVNILKEEFLLLEALLHLIFNTHTDFTDSRARRSICTDTQAYSPLRWRIPSSRA